MKKKTTSIPLPFGGSTKTVQNTDVPKGKDFFSTIMRLSHYLRNYIGPVNDSKIFAGCMIIILNIGSKYVNMRLPKPIEGYLKFTFSRNILVFAICWMGTRDILTALLITILFVIIMDVFLNDESKYCCLPESFIDYHREAMTNADLSNNQQTTDVSKNVIVLELPDHHQPEHHHDDLIEEGSSGGSLGFSHYF